VGAVSNLPLRGWGTVNTFTTDLMEAHAQRHDRVANFYEVLPGYFESVGIPLLRGRSFTDQDYFVLAFAVPAGSLLSLAGARLLESLVCGVNVWDIGSLLTCAVPGAFIGLLGTAAPVLRAARTDVSAVPRVE